MFARSLQQRAPALRNSVARNYAQAASRIGDTKVAMSPLNPDAYINYRGWSLPYARFARWC